MEHDIDSEPQPEGQLHTGSEATHSQPLAIPLRREAVVAPRGSGRLAFLFAMCTLSGVAMGFGLRGAATSGCPYARNAPRPAHHADSSRFAFLGLEMVDTPDGVHVVRIFRGTPAAELAAAGLLNEGDIIEGLAGKPVTSALQVVREIRSRAPGERISMELRRPGEKAHILLEAELSWTTMSRLRLFR